MGPGYSLFDDGPRAYFRKGTMDLLKSNGEIRILAHEAINWSLFEGRRVSIYAASDGERLAGWLASGENGRVIVRSSQEIHGASGTSYLFQIFSNKFDLLFVAKLEATVSSKHMLNGKAAQDITFGIVGSVRRVPVSRNARKVAYGARALLSVDGVASEIALEDMSPNGIGFLHETELPIQHDGHLHMQLPEGDVHLLIKIANCQALDDQEKNLWRVGATVEAADRVSNALWLKISQ